MARIKAASEGGWKGCDTGSDPVGHPADGGKRVVAGLRVRFAADHCALPASDSGADGADTDSAEFDDAELRLLAAWNRLQALCCPGRPPGTLYRHDLDVGHTVAEQSGRTDYGMHHVAFRPGESSDAWARRNIIDFDGEGGRHGGDEGEGVAAPEPAVELQDGDGPFWVPGSGYRGPNRFGNPHGLDAWLAAAFAGQQEVAVAAAEGEGDGQWGIDFGHTPQTSLDVD
jgi:hypothetical protein